MFNSILDFSSGSLSITSALICSGISLVLGVIVSVLYMFRNTTTKSMAVTLALMPALVQVIIMMVNGNLGTGIAVLGAFSLIRFRSVPGSAREISSIFFAMAIGLATGMGYLSFACAITVIIGAAQLIFFLTPFGENASPDKDLRITIPEDLDYSEVFDDIFEKYTRKHSLEQVKTTNLGSMFDLKYNIQIKNPAREKAMIDEIRCRNGNLTVALGRCKTIKEEL